MAGLDATETENEPPQPKFQFTRLLIRGNYNSEYLILRNRLTFSPDGPDGTPADTAEGDDDGENNSEVGCGGDVGQ